MRHAANARNLLREMPCEELIQRIKRAGDLYLNDTLPLGDGSQSPDEFARAQSATTGLPEHMCKANMQKNFFVLSHMDQMLEALTRGLPLDILTRGYGVESRGVVVSFQAQTPVLGLVLPSNSPGVHTLWMPVIPMQVGLVLKPGPQEPWTPYRMTAAMVEAGIPAGAISIYPGGGDVGAAVLASCSRSLIFGGTPTVERYRGNPHVQAHGPGFSKILLGDDVVDHWRDYVDLMAESVYINSGRGCINCSSIWAPRHTQRNRRRDCRTDRPDRAAPAGRPASRSGGFHGAWNGRQRLENDRSRSARKRRRGHDFAIRPAAGRIAALRVFAAGGGPCRFAGGGDREKGIHVPVRDRGEMPAAQMLESIGPTLVCTAITDDPAFQQSLADATHVDRLNIGPIPTTKLDWLQPHEGNIVDFLFRARAFQIPPDRLAKLKS